MKELIYELCEHRIVSVPKAQHALFETECHKLNLHPKKCKNSFILNHTLNKSEGRVIANHYDLEKEYDSLINKGDSVYDALDKLFIL